MQKYMALLKYELKTIFKDSMGLFMMFYPLLMLFITGFLLPEILARTTTPDSNASAITLLIGFVVTLSIGGYIMGVMLGFSLLENKDENTLQNIAASPVRISGYTLFKTTYTYFLALIGNWVMVGGLKLIASSKYQVTYQSVTIGLLDQITWGHVAIYAFVSSLIVPAVALVVAAVAKNKIEGFAFMKSGGLVIMMPLLALLNVFLDWKQYLLGIFPNFWYVKPLLNIALSLEQEANMSFYLYMVIGAIYTIGLSFLTYRLFMKKANLK